MPIKYSAYSPHRSYGGNTSLSSKSFCREGPNGNSHAVHCTYNVFFITFYKFLWSAWVVNAAVKHIVMNRSFHMLTNSCFTVFRKASQDLNHKTTLCPGVDIACRLIPLWWQTYRIIVLFFYNQFTLKGIKYNIYVYNIWYIIGTPFLFTFDIV